MREIHKRNVISAQISFYPLNEIDCFVPIDKVLKIIDQSGIDYNAGDMSTVIRGESANVLNLIRDITNEMNDEGCKFSMNVSLSNFCGVET